MSWDVLLHRAPDGATVAELPEGCALPPLGSPTEVRRTIRATLPQVDLSDPTWGVLHGPTWTIELLTGEEDPVTLLTLLVRGTGDDALVPIFDLARALDCAVEDTTEGRLLNGPEDTDGWHSFQNFRAQVFGGR